MVAAVIGFARLNEASWLDKAAGRVMEASPAVLKPALNSTSPLAVLASRRGGPAGSSKCAVKVPPAEMVGGNSKLGISRLE